MFRETTALRIFACLALFGLAACGQGMGPSGKSGGFAPEVSRANMTPMTTVASKGLENGATSPLREEVTSTRQEAHRMDRVRIGPADLGDAGSTAAALAVGGFVEANPVLSWAGGAAPLVAMPFKYLMKKGAVSAGVAPARANWSVETASSFATCANVGALAGAVPPLALATGAICALTYGQYTKNRYERETGRTLDGKPHAPS